MVDVVLSLGSNLGDRALNMARMEQEVGLLIKPPLLRSRLMETEPVGTISGQPWFYNRIIRGVSGGTPHELLAACLSIEKELGRTRSPGERYAARTADVDILLFGGEIIREKDLIIPHPAIAERRFCLLGLSEVAPDIIFPGTIKHIDELTAEWLKHLEGQRVQVLPGV